MVLDLMSDALHLLLPCYSAVVILALADDY